MSNTLLKINEKLAVVGFLLVGVGSATEYPKTTRFGFGLLLVTIIFYGVLKFKRR